MVVLGAYLVWFFRDPERIPPPEKGIIVAAADGVIARITQMDQSAKEAVAAPRVHHGGDPDVTYYEPELSVEALAHLSQTGHRTAATPVLGGVNVLSCPGGLPTKPASCQMIADPRGLGLAAGSML